MTFVLCSAKNLVTIRLECVKIQVFRYESGSDTLHTQNMNHNVLSRPIRDAESLCYRSNANATIFDVIVINRGGWMTRMRQVFYLTTLTEYFMPHKYLRSRWVDSPKQFYNIFNDSVAVIPLQTQNFKQTRCSIFFP